MSQQASPRDDNEEYSVPQELQELNQWVCEEDKIPKVADDSGDNASTNNPETWRGFTEAVKMSLQKAGRGIGFVLTEDDPYLVIDFDDVRNPESGDTEDWVFQAIEEWDSYAEVSPSGTGIHVWLKGVSEPDQWVDTEHIEVYDSGQYITVTGDHIPDTPTTCATPSEFEEWLQEHGDINEPAPPTQKSQNGPGGHERGVELDVYDVLSHSRYPEGDRVSHPIHGSSTNTNFKVFDGGETWHCFRHGVTGNALHLIGMEARVISCGDWKNRDLTDEEWAKIFDAGREAGYSLPEPPDNSSQLSTPTSIVEAIIASPERWISPDEKTITVWDIGEQDAADVKDVFEEQSLDADEALEIIHKLDDTYSSAFSEFWNDDDGWTVEVAGPDDKWTEVRMRYDKGPKVRARDLAVNLLREEYHFVTVSDNEQMYCYDPETGVYEANAEQVVKQRLEKMLKAYYSRREVNEILARLQSGSYIDREEFGQSESQICVANGIVDIETGELSEFDPNYYFRSRLPVEYDPDAECSKFEEFLDDVCPDDKILMLQEFVGYCLNPRMHHKKALLILGPTDAGKSVFLNVLQALFGADSTVNLSVQYLANQRWGEAELVGKMVNIRHDLDSTDIKNAGKIKELTAGNPVRAERKNQDPFRFQPRTKHIFAANQPPARSSEDDGFWNRWLTVVFPERILREEQDPKLTEKVTTNEELAGVLNWAIEGYQRLEEEGRFTGEPTPSENRQMWETYGNSVERFINGCLEREPSAVVRKDKAYDAYTEFAKDEGTEVVTKHKFTSELKQKGASVKQRRYDGQRERVYTGFRLSNGSSATSRDSIDSSEIAEGESEDLDKEVEELFG